MPVYLHRSVWYSMAKLISTDFLGFANMCPNFDLLLITHHHPLPGIISVPGHKAFLKLLVFDNKHYSRFNEVVFVHFAVQITTTPADQAIQLS